MMALETPVSAAFGLTMAVLGHTVGWPMAKGGSHAITNAMAEHFLSLGGEIITNQRVISLEQVPPARAVLFNLTPRQIIDIAGDSLPSGYRQTINRFKYGPGVFKLDWALDGPIPWTSQDCALAGTVHVGGTFEEIAAAERAVWQGKHPERPFIILAQQSLFDPTRAPQGKHTAWAYCHVPNGSELDQTERIEAQIERFAPGFKDRIIERASYNSRQIEEYNPNYVGGDINGGLQILRQQFTRPAGIVYLLLLHSTGRRSSWYVWLLRCESGDERSPEASVTHVCVVSSALVAT
jgi:phytoene dehydrogenase-like protein